MHDVESVIVDAEVIEETTPRQEYVKGLRAIADLLEAHPEIDPPYSFGDSKWSPVRWMAGSVKEAAAIQRAIGGRWDKNDPNNSSYDAETLVLTRKLGEEVHIRLTVSRENVCEKIDTGTTERKKVRKLVSKPVYEEVYEDVPKYELKCGSLLSAADKIALEEL